MKSHLIIQGPMLSYYNSLFPAQGAEGEVRIDGRPVFDCTATVSRLVRELRPYFDSVVLSTWDNEPLNNREELAAQNVVVVQTPSAQVRHVPNVRKQVVSVLAGLKQIPALDAADRITKIRTDQYFDVLSFVAHAERADEQHVTWQSVGQQGYLHVGSSRGPFLFEDMYVTARAGDFFRMWDALDPRRGIPTRNIHMALGVDYAIVEQKRLGVSTWQLFDAVRWVVPIGDKHRLAMRSKLWQKLFGQCFCLAPKFPQDQFIWRGLPLSHPANMQLRWRYAYYDDWLRFQRNPEILWELSDHAHMIEWQRWHSFRRFGGRVAWGAKLARAVLQAKRGAASWQPTPWP